MNRIFIKIKKNLKRNNIFLDINGKFYKILEPLNFKTKMLKIISLILIGFIASIIKRITFYPITIIGNTVYSRVAASYIKRRGKKYAICKTNNRIYYYNTKDNEEIAFEGERTKSFIEDNIKTTVIIPHTDKELLQLQKHTKIQNLSEIQDKVLNYFEKDDNIYFQKFENIVHDEKDAKNPIIFVKKLCKNLYYIRSINEVWITKLIIGDSVSPLNINDTILCLSKSIYNLDNENRNTLYKDNCVTINDFNKTYFLTKYSGYLVNNDLSLSSFDNDEENDNNEENELVHDKETIIYSLNKPRSFIKNNIINIHPFHFNQTFDPFLTVMILTESLIEKL